MRAERIWLGLAALGALGADQATKSIAWREVHARPLVLAGGVVRLHATRNQGLSGGLLERSEAAPWIAILLAAVVVTGALWIAYSFRNATRSQRVRAALAAGVVVGGVLGNVADRLVQRCEAPVPIAQLNFHQLVQNATKIAQAQAAGSQHAAPCGTGVVDFISLHIAPGVRSPVFNVADALIVAGLVVLVVVWRRANANGRGPDGGEPGDADPTPPA